MNLAEQLRRELTERAKNSESCKKYLLDWVMKEFRNGNNPVDIQIKNTIDLSLDTDLAERLGFERRKYERAWIKFKYEDGRHFAKFQVSIRTKQSVPDEWVDITDTDYAQRYCVDGIDKSDKILFLESEGFKVHKEWIYGRGDLLRVYY